MGGLRASVAATLAQGWSIGTVLVQWHCGERAAQPLTERGLQSMAVGWAIVGCSDIVEKRSGDAIAGQACSRLVALHSRNGERAREFAARFGAEYGTTDLDAILADGRVHVVYVANEVDRHREIALAALRAGKHVLVEKPMALDTGECMAMIEGARDAGRHLAVAYYSRFFEKSRAMKQAIEDGRLGHVVRAVVRNICYYNPAVEDPKYWRVTHRGGGNLLADVGSHRLDLLCYFLGRPARVSGLADRLSMSYQAADTESALVRMESGAHVVAMANANVRHPGTPTTSVEIFGTEGALLTDPWSDEPVTVVGSNEPPVPVHRPENNHAALVDDFAVAIAEGRAPRFSGIDGMWATAIIAGAHESARSGRAVDI